MPYRDPEKKKEYYHRHQKYYMKKWRKESDWWKNYQKNYKKEKRKQVAMRIKEDAMKSNIAENNSLTFKAWTMLVLMLETGITKTSAIAKRFQYDYAEVKTIFENWVENNIWDGEHFNMEITDDDKNNHMELILVAMCGAGLITRKEEQNI